MTWTEIQANTLCFDTRGVAIYLDSLEIAFRLAGASPQCVHLLDLLEDGSGPRLTDFHVLAFVGGFAFGDHLGAGFVFANKIRWRLYDQLLKFIGNGGLALGICNGFQTMVRLGVLPGLDGDYRTPRATLAPNDRLGYRDAWVRLAFDADSPCVWTRGLTTMEMPNSQGMVVRIFLKKNSNGINVLQLTMIQNP